MKTGLTIILFTLNILKVFAFEFEVDGKYYNVINENSVEITFKDSLYNSYTEKDIIIPNFVNYSGKEYKVTQIGKHAFAHCSGLHSIIIPESVIVIENSAFMSCENLNIIELPNSIEEINKYAFVMCKNISSISIPPKVRSIEEATFLGCENLEFIELPENLTNIESIAFMFCSKLKSITLPKNIDNLQGCAIFNDCESLESIKLTSNIPPKINPMLVEDINLKQCKLFVPIGSKIHYEKAEIWKDFASIEEFR